MVSGLAKCYIADVKEEIVTLAASDDDLGAVAIEHDEQIWAVLRSVKGDMRGVRITVRR